MIKIKRPYTGHIETVNRMGEIFINAFCAFHKGNRSFLISISNSQWDEETAIIGLPKWKKPDPNFPDHYIRTEETML